MMGDWLRRGVFTLAIAFVVACAVFHREAAGWAWRLTGARDEAGAPYGLLSGFFGAVQPTLAITAAIFYYQHTCHHSRWCLRWGAHQAAGGVFKTCRWHHPDLKHHTGPLHQLIPRLHAEHHQRLAGRAA